LHETPPPIFQYLTVRDIMVSPVTAVCEIASVGDVLRMLRSSDHNGFPVVRPSESGDFILCGMLLRRQLVAILCGIIKEQKFGTKSARGIVESTRRLSRQSMRSGRLSIQRDSIMADGQIALTEKVKEGFIFSALKSKTSFDAQRLLNGLTEAERAREIDLSPFMDSSPHTASSHMTLIRVYRLFNELGVRHVPVVGHRNELVGIMVRKDIVPEVMSKKAYASAANKNCNSRLSTRQSKVREALTAAFDKPVKRRKSDAKQSTTGKATSSSRMSSAGSATPSQSPSAIRQLGNLSSEERRHSFAAAFERCTSSGSCFAKHAENLADDMSHSELDGAEHLQVFGAKISFKGFCGRSRSPSSNNGDSSAGDSVSNQSTSFNIYGSHNASRNVSRDSSPRGSRRPSRRPSRQLDLPQGLGLQGGAPPGVPLKDGVPLRERVRRGSAPTMMQTNEEKQALQELLKQCPDPEKSCPVLSAAAHKALSARSSPPTPSSPEGRERSASGGSQRKHQAKPANVHDAAGRRRSQPRQQSGELPGSSQLSNSSPPQHHSSAAAPVNAPQIRRRGSSPAVCTSTVLQQLNEEYPELMQDGSQARES